MNRHLKISSQVISLGFYALVAASLASCAHESVSGEVAEVPVELTAPTKADEAPAEFAKVLPGTEGEDDEGEMEVAVQEGAPATPVATAPAEPPAAAIAVASNQAAPMAPSEPVRFGSTILNRYYFLRLGDTPESAASLLLGSAKKSNDLLAWNGGIGKWEPGTMILYQSARTDFANDMLSFYQEAAARPEEYLVAKGDTLASIAEKRYGSRDTWKELAMINGVRNPNSLEPGRKLTLYPAELHTSLDQAQREAVAMVPDVAEVKAEVAANEPPIMIKQPAAPELASPEVGSFFQRHGLALLMGFGALALAIFIVQRRRKMRSDMYRF